MKHFTHFLISLMLLSTSCAAQFSAPDYAVAWSLKQNGFRQLIGKEKGRVCEERGFPNLPGFPFDLVLEKMALRENGRALLSQQDTLLLLYPPGPEDPLAFESSIWDSLNRSLTISSFDKMSFSSTTYFFDSLGTLIRRSSEYQGEASGNRGETLTQYKYDKTTHTVTSTSVFGEGGSVTETVWDPSLSYPVKQAINSTSGFQFSSSLTFILSYKKGCLVRIKTEHIRNNISQPDRDVKYYFE